MEKEGFTGIKDVDKELLLSMDDRTFIKTCNLNTYFQNLCNDQNELVFKRKLQLSYPDTLKPEILQPYWIGSWKLYYAHVVKTIARLKEKFKFDYTGGNPFKQLNILKAAYFSPSFLMNYGIINNEISIVKLAAKKRGVFPHDLQEASQLQDKTILNFLKLKR
jgi:hypothetical protein